MTLFQISSLAVCFFAFAFFLSNFGRVISVLATAKPTWRLDGLHKRAWVFVQEVFLHRKLLRVVDEF